MLTADALCFDLFGKGIPGLCLMLVLIFLAACGGGGASNNSAANSSLPVSDTVIADFKGQYIGTVDYNLTQYSKKGVPMQADVNANGELTNVKIDDTNVSNSTETVLLSSNVKFNGVIQGSEEFNIQGVNVKVSYTGNIDPVTGIVNIVYNVSGGLSGNIVINGNRVTPYADTSGSYEYVTMDNNVNQFANVILDASKSTPSTSSLLSYNWEFVSRPIGSNVAINNNNAPKANFIPDVGGVYVIKLTAYSSKYSSSSTTLSVFANSQPVAENIAKQTVLTGDTVVLDGNNSYDEYGNKLKYRWSFTSVPGLASFDNRQPNIASESSPKTSFIPKIDGLYKLKLTVIDNNGRIVSDTPVAITVKAALQDNGDGTVTDKYTGLMWQKDDNNISSNWWYASGTYNKTENLSTVSMCSQVNAGSFSDWRLPNISELNTLSHNDIMKYNFSTYWSSNINPINWASTVIYSTLDPQNLTHGTYPAATIFGVRCVR